MPRMPAPKAPYHHGDLRRVAVARAAQVIGESGVDALGLRSIARDLSVTHAALVHHFGDRQALLQEVAREGFEALANSLQSASIGHASDELRLLAVGTAYLQVARQLPGHFTVMFGRDIISANTPLPLPLQAASERAFAALLQALESPRLDGRALLAWSAVHGLASLWGQGPLLERVGSVAALERLVQETLSLLAASVVPPKKPRAK